MAKILHCRKQGGDCSSCFMDDVCPRWNDTGLETPVVDEYGNVVGFAMPTSPDYDENGVEIY